MSKILKQSLSIILGLTTFPMMLQFGKICDFFEHSFHNFMYMHIERGHPDTDTVFLLLLINSFTLTRKCPSRCRYRFKQYLKTGG